MKECVNGALRWIGIPSRVCSRIMHSVTGILGIHCDPDQDKVLSKDDE